MGIQWWSQAELKNDYIQDKVGQQQLNRASHLPIPITKVSFAEIFDVGLYERSILGRDSGWNGPEPAGESTYKMWSKNMLNV